MADRLTRIAIVTADRCKPKKCRQECKKSCPVVKTGEKPRFILFSLNGVVLVYTWKCSLLNAFILVALNAGKLCIEVSSSSKIAFISEELCIGCGICVKVRGDMFCC